MEEPLQKLWKKIRMKSRRSQQHGRPPLALHWAGHHPYLRRRNFAAIDFRPSVSLSGRQGVGCRRFPFKEMALAIMRKRRIASTAGVCTLCDFRLSKQGTEVPTLHTFKALRCPRRCLRNNLFARACFRLAHFYDSFPLLFCNDCQPIKIKLWNHFNNSGLFAENSR